MNRRGFLMAAAQAPLALKDFEPKSMLVTPETKVPRARFPVIDFHAHLSWAARAEKGVSLTGDRKVIDPPSALLPVMDRKNVRTLVNLTGGYEKGLSEAIARFDRAHPGRFLTFTEPAWARANEPGYAQRQADLIAQAAKQGARGVKVLKTLGRYLRSGVTTGKYFDYAPAAVPAQGRWRISGLGLAEGELRKVYQGNAGRILKS